MSKARAGLRLDRRRYLKQLLAAGGALAASGCDRLAGSPRGTGPLAGAESLTYRAQRLLLGRDALAQEYPATDISPHPRSNGSSTPGTDEYNALASNGFRDWRLEVGGLVERPLSLSLDEVRQLPSRT